jgi:hypothetical protein
MAAAEDDSARKRRKYPTVLVAIPGWPTQDPGRVMLYSVRPTPQKAARMIKRLRRQLPEFEWSTRDLTAAEAREIKQAPFVLDGSGLAVPMECRWTGRSWKVTPVAGS